MVYGGGLFYVESMTFRILQPYGRCPLGLGYWKSHPNAWPVKTLVLGDQGYQQAELLALLKNAPAGDASLILARQLISANLNIANGSDATAQVTDAMSSANNWLYLSGKLPSNIKPTSTPGQALLNAAAVLEQFNNGLLTAECVSQ
jgi:hypothetical protein